MLRLLNFYVQLLLKFVCGFRLAYLNFFCNLFGFSFMFFYLFVILIFILPIFRCYEFILLMIEYNIMQIVLMVIKLKFGSFYYMVLNCAEIFNTVDFRNRINLYSLLINGEVNLRVCFNIVQNCVWFSFYINVFNSIILKFMNFYCEECLVSKFQNLFRAFNFLMQSM